jgi:hypothetical protein
MPATLEQGYHEAISTHLERRTMNRTIPELKSREELAAVTLLDALDVDERPSFAIHVQHTLDFDFDANAPLELEYSNAAFTRIDGLLARVTGKPAAGSVFVEHGGPQMAFRKWLQGAQDDLDLAQRGKSYMFDGLIWTAVTVDALKIVSGLHASLHLEICRCREDHQYCPHHPYYRTSLLDTHRGLKRPESMVRTMSLSRTLRFRF